MSVADHQRQPDPTNPCKKCGTPTNPDSGIQEKSLLLSIFANEIRAGGGFTALTSGQVYICAVCRYVVEDALQELGFVLEPTIKPKPVLPPLEDRIQRIR